MVEKKKTLYRLMNRSFEIYIDAMCEELTSYDKIYNMCFSINSVMSRKIFKVFANYLCRHPKKEIVVSRIMDYASCTQILMRHDLEVDPLMIIPALSVASENHFITFSKNHTFIIFWKNLCSERKIFFFKNNQVGIIKIILNQGNTFDWQNYVFLISQEHVNQVLCEITINVWVAPLVDFISVLHENGFIINLNQRVWNRIIEHYIVPSTSVSEHLLKEIIILYVKADTIIVDRANIMIRYRINKLKKLVEIFSAIGNKKIKIYSPIYFHIFLIELFHNFDVEFSTEQTYDDYISV